MRTLLYVFLLSSSIFAQQEEQLASKLRTVLETEEQFLAPLNQTLSAVAEENGYAIDESYTYTDGTEPYDHFFKTKFKGNLLKKISIAGVFIAAPIALTVGSFLKRKFTLIPYALFLASMPAIPYEMNVFAMGPDYVKNRIYIASDCLDSFLNCVARKKSGWPPYYIIELHYKLASLGFTGSCFVMFTPDNYPVSNTEGYELVPIDDPLFPFRESAKLNFEITNCTHKGVFPEQNDVVATGSIDLKRESL